MKNILLTILILFTLEITAQTTSDVLDSVSSKAIFMTPKAGSCGSPDGPMFPIGAPPPSYAWLQANGWTRNKPSKGSGLPLEILES